MRFRSFSRSARAARADFGSCKQQIKAQAAASGVSQATLARALDGLEPNDAVSFLGVQPEFTTPIWDYIAGLVDDERVRDGQARFSEYKQAALTAQQRYGVDAAAIVAVWGVESDFGKSFGGRPIIQSLTTLACTPNRRSDYFRGELIAALKILDHGDVKLEEFNGSWAGAFGNTQFMPSTFLSLAVDLDGDGKRDVINSVPDALGSTANFLHHAGWVTGLPWGFEVRLPAGYAGPSGRGGQEAAVVLGRTRPDPRQWRADFGLGRLWPAAALGAAWPRVPGVAEFRRLLFLQRRRILCACDRRPGRPLERRPRHCHALADRRPRNIRASNAAKCRPCSRSAATTSAARSTA